MTNWFQLARPTSGGRDPTRPPILQATVDWGLTPNCSAGPQGGGDRRQPGFGPGGPQRLPAARPAAGRGHPGGQTMAADPSETATIDTQAPLVIQQLREKGSPRSSLSCPSTCSIRCWRPRLTGLLPRLLLVDYESSIQVALGLIPAPYAQALNGQEGVTTETSGGSTTTGRRARVATTPGCAAAGRPGTRPTRRSHRAT